MHVTAGPAGTIRIPRERCRIQRRAVRVGCSLIGFPFLIVILGVNHAGLTQRVVRRRAQGHCDIPATCRRARRRPRLRHATPTPGRPRGLKGLRESGRRRVVLLLDPARHLIRTNRSCT